MSIQSWPLMERPREKLISLGVEALSDAELLAIILGNGMHGKCAVTLARDLLTHFGSLRGVVTASKNQLCSISGIGHVKFCLLKASVELATRHLGEPLKVRESFSHAEHVKDYLQAKLKDQKSEQFGLLLLDSQHQLLAYKTMFKGTINSAAVYPREIVKQVIEDNAAAVILVHNHPSGVAEPSEADVRITHQIKSALELIDVPVLDHIIVADIHTTSFAQRGLI
ncbi:DNA repair protein RadC [Alteromonas ponticola]|uniref:DNA repair protein RadC n=1 Tax=Alteromonas aquimaris TaxID=2998417 RepID=A0ABT3PB10_9ALTE|nr:DNA repair protein RadC [Alteromonas aquimaris]MCW8109956.1 DNA repair protein RadC [Alteromonas aquimaris]